MPVAGMPCPDCGGHVVRAREGAGASAATADVRRGEARFTAPASVDRGALATAVREAGYEPGEIEVLQPARPTHRRNGRNGAEYDLAVIGSGGGAFAPALQARDPDAPGGMGERGTPRGAPGTNGA